MKISPGTAKYFYQTSKLTTVIGNDQKRSMLRIEALPLAELSEKEASSTKLLATDEMGSVLIVRTPDDMQINHSYTAFGYNHKLPAEFAAIGYNGEYMLENMHLYLLGQGHRGFSTEIGRFIAPDNAGSPFGRGGINAFTYCLNDPMNRKDETGMWSIFKPRTWFRNTQTKKDQRLGIIADKKNEIINKTKFLNDLIEERRSRGNPIQPTINKTARKLEKIYKRSERKAAGVNKYLDKDHMHLFPHFTKAKQALAAAKKPNYTPQGNTRKEANWTSPTRTRDDQYDDKNYRTNVSEQNFSTRRS